MPSVTKAIFSFGFSPDQMGPIIQMQHAIFDQNALNSYYQRSIMDESIMRREHHAELARAVAEKARAVKKGVRETRGSGAEKRGRGAETSVSDSYSISYYNPELKKTEVLVGKTEVKFQNAASQAVEESIGSQSALALYSFVASPIMRTEVLPWRLEGILAERDYGTPPPPPAGAGVTPVPVVVKKTAEIAAEKRRAEAVRAALSEFVLRKERCEQAIHDELLLMAEVVECLRAGDDLEAALERLPPLSRARFLLLLRKKLLGRKALLALLLLDMSFLRTLEKKLGLFTLEDLVGIYRALRQLKK
jgi:hypothetical protein